MKINSIFFSFLFLALLDCIAMEQPSKKRKKCKSVNVKIFNIAGLKPKEVENFFTIARLDNPLEVKKNFKIIQALSLEVALCVANFKNENGDTLAHLYASLGFYEGIEFLDKINACMKVKNKRRETPLYNAAQKGNLEVFKYLYKKGYFFDEDYDHVNNPLNFLVQMHEEGAFLLYKKIEKDFDVHSDLLLYYTCAGGGLINFLQHFITRSSSLNDCSRLWQGKTPVHLAAEGGHCQHLDLLLKNSYSVKAQDDFGCTPAYYAAYNGHKKALDVLFNHGDNFKDLNLRYMPFHAAVLNNKKEIVSYFIEKKVTVDVLDENSDTALAYAIRNNNDEIVVELLLHGADVRFADNSFNHNEVNEKIKTLLRNAELKCARTKNCNSDAWVYG